MHVCQQLSLIDFTGAKLLQLTLMNFVTLTYRL